VTPDPAHLSVTGLRRWNRRDANTAVASSHLKEHLKMTPLSRKQMAWRAAQDLKDGTYVNLGIGLPTLVADYIPTDREIVFHSENGILGLGRAPAPGEEDPDVINAGKGAASVLPGGSFFHHNDAFLMIRGGHIDVCLMGAFEVSETGDLANWSTEDPGFPPGVGGAMDLAVGAREVRAYYQGRQTTDSQALRLSAHGRALCEPNLYQPRSARRHARWTGGPRACGRARVRGTSSTNRGAARSRQ